MSKVGSPPPPGAGGAKLIDLTALARSHPAGEPGTAQGQIISLCDYVAASGGPGLGTGFPSSSVWQRGPQHLDELRARCEQAEISGIDPSVLTDPEGRRILEEWLAAWQDPELQEEVAAGLRRSGLLS